MKGNKIIFIIVLLVLGVFFIVTTCYRSGEKKNARVLPPGTHGVVIADIIQTSNYTYLQVDENNNKFWIAVMRVDAKKGDSVYYSKAYEMKDFVSKELNRTFPSVFFVEDATNKLPSAAPASPAQLTPGKPNIVKWNEISVQTPKGGITIADLYKGKDSYAGKSVIIRGVVVKYNPQVMNKNWVHIQDATEFSGKFDLTVTTLDSLVVGKTATFTGIIAVNKDFGSGYSYEIIMEQAKASNITDK
jgi:hypothetical protein